MDSEIETKIKRALADNVTIKYKHKLTKNKAHMNTITTIDRIPTDIVNKSNNTNDKMRDVIVAETILKLVSNSSW